MRSHPPSRWLRPALVGFLAVDLIGLISLVINQFVSENPVYPWLLGMGLVLIALPLLAQAADYLLEAPAHPAIVPNAGEKIP